jgi:hypothetical protein
MDLNFLAINLPPVFAAQGGFLPKHEIRTLSPRFSCGNIITLAFFDVNWDFVIFCTKIPFSADGTNGTGKFVHFSVQGFPQRKIYDTLRTKRRAEVRRYGGG